MAVYDRWHKDPAPGDQPCKCGKGRARLYPSADHEAGDRWQVRWRHPATGKQRKRNFALRARADAFDKENGAAVLKPGWVDPDAGKAALRDYAETWRKARRMPREESAARLERKLRLHVYEDPARPGSGRTPTGRPSIGQHPMGLLAARPSVTAEWAAGIKLAPRPARQVLGVVSRVFRVAVGDGIVGRDPTRAEGVEWPALLPRTARAWSLGQLEAMRGELGERWRVLLDLGAGTGMRQGEMLGLGVDDIDWLKRDDPRVRVTRQLRHAGGKAVFGPVKNRAPHSPPLSPELRARLAAHLERYPAVTVTLPWDDPEDRERHGKDATVRLLVTSPGGTPAWGTTVSNAFHDAALAAGVTPDGGRVRDDGCHALRHTFASTCLRSHIDVVRVADWLGDTVEMVTTTYLHLLPGDDGEDGRAAVDAFFAGPPVEGSGDRNVPSEAAE